MRLRILSRRVFGGLVLAALLTGCAAHQVPSCSERDDDGLTALHRAAGRGDAPLTELLLGSGADPKAVDSMGASPLHKAAYSGDAATITELIQKGAIVDLQAASNGNTALHDALYFRSGHDLRAIEALLTGGANLFLRNRAGLTPIDSARLLKDREALTLLTLEQSRRYPLEFKKLIAAVRKNRLKQVRKCLEKAGIHINRADEQGFTPLMWASREGFVEIVDLLLLRGADPNQRDIWMGANSGHKAAFWGRAEVMKRLISHGLDLDAQGRYNGYTALHDAVAGGHVSVVRLLIDAKAQNNIAGHDGKTAVDLARLSHNPEIKRLLDLDL